MTRSLGLRLAGGAIIAIALALSVVWWTLEEQFSTYVASRYREEMQVVSDAVAAGLVIRNGQLVLQREPADTRFANPFGGRFWQVSPEDGDPIRSRSLWDTVLPDHFSMQPAYGFSRAEGPEGRPLLVLSQPSMLNAGGTTHRFIIHAAFPESEFDTALGDFQNRLRVMLLTTALLLSFAAFLQGFLGLEPLRRLRTHVAAVREGRENRITGSGPSEVQPLVSELNQLLKERENAVERARSRASDLAHGLKTPLTVLAHLAESLPDRERAIALEQVDLILQRAGRQLQAARMGVERMSETPLAVLVRRLASVFAPVTEERGIVWSIDIDEALVLPTDPADLAEALGNLLDNAAKWTCSHIHVSARRLGQEIIISIADDGPGVAEADRATILERGGSFGEGSGHGLGLAIAADISAAYGGKVTIGRSEWNGLLVELSVSTTSERRIPKNPA